MIIININLHSAIDHSISSLGSMVIYNDGTGTKDIGNYKATFFDSKGNTIARAEVDCFPRTKKDYLDLMKAVLKNMKRNKK